MGHQDIPEHGCRFAGTRIPIREDRRLRECDSGILNGAPLSQLAPIRSRHIRQPYPGGQSCLDVVAQARYLLAEVARDWDGQRILLIAHSANRWALDHLLRGIPLEELLCALFSWQEGWYYTLPTPWSGR